MKQHLAPEQTAKLIELGFEKPKHTFIFKLIEYNDVKKNIDIPVSNYSIGALLSILPLTIGKNYDLHIEFSVTKWYVAYYWIGNGGEYYIKYECSACEFIDAVYMMIVKLKEE